MRTFGTQQALCTLSLAVLLALTGCVASEASEPGSADLGVTAQAVTNVRTGDGTFILCASSIVLNGAGNLQSCILANNTNVRTGTGAFVFFRAATLLAVFPTGAAQQGVLLNNTNVRTATGAFLTFAANTGLALDAAGNGFSGVIASDTNIHTGAGFAPCMAAQLVNLFPTGNVQTCVLFTTMTFPNGSGGTLSCNTGHRITLSAAGIFQSCV
jgi:hypothetical protein